MTRVSYANRGQDLENMIELTNQEYVRQGQALVQKIPVPFKQIGPIKNNGQFTACRESKSTVDYLGIYNEVGIAFDAKETKVETRFDLGNVKDHQYTFLSSWVAAGGIGFLIIWFTTQDEKYYLPFEVLDEYWQNSLKGGRQSIPYDEIAKPEYRIKQGKQMVLIDYLEVVERVMQNE